ncbi:MAG: carboxypeptidase regulatory-like domain-containing protein [Candidatus Altiarchaeota archaeon]
MNSKNFISLAMVIFLFGFISLNVNAAKDIKLNVDVVPSSIIVGENFNVLITLEYDGDDIETSDDITIKIYKEGVLVHDKEYNLPYRLNSTNTTYTFNISSTSFRVDNADVWNKNLMNYECGDNQEIKVEISGDVKSRDDTDDIDINPYKEDYELSFTISPENPNVDQKIVVHVVDEDNDDLKDAKVKFTRLEDNDAWDYDDTYLIKTTDSKGEVILTNGLSGESKFRSAPYSKYQVDVYKEGKYCKVTKFFDTRRRLNITEIPSPIFVGKAIKLRIVDDSGVPVANANLMVSKTGFSQKFTSDNSGYVIFTLEEEGTYNLIASKTGYGDSDIKSIAVNVRGNLGVSITPKDAILGSSVKIVITASDGSLLSGAKIQITKPDGTKEALLTTPETGQVSYIPSIPGTYTLRVEEASHLPRDDSFIALNEFTLTLPQEITLYQDIEIVVRDQNGLTVGGASITIDSITGTTDNEGKFKFKLENPGSYTITVKKANFRDKTQTITTIGNLKLELSSKEIFIDEPITIKVTDQLGKEITDATIEITKPDSTKESSGREYKPQTDGNYIVTVSKANYRPATENFTVRRIPLEMKVDVIGNRIVATLSKNGEPLQNIPVKIDTIFGGEEILTDELGKAEFEIVNITEKINVTISVNSPKYEKLSVERQVVPTSPLTNIAIGIIVVIILVLLVYIQIRRRKPKKEKSLVGTSLLQKEKRKGSSLSGLSKL